MLPIAPASAHHDVGFRSLNAVQLLDLIDHELVKPLRVRALRLDKNIRHAPAGVHVPHTLEFGDCGGEVAHLSPSGVDQDVGSHGNPLPLPSSGPRLRLASDSPLCKLGVDSPSANGRPSR